MSWMRPRRVTEATLDQLVTSGAVIGLVDDDIGPGFRRAGGSSENGRPMPHRTLERARRSSVAGYRINPMARAIIDTYTSFCVGDSGLTLHASNSDVRDIAERFWRDPRTQLDTAQELLFQDHLIMGETALELLVDNRSGTTLYSPIDPTRVTEVVLDRGNPMWHSQLVVAGYGEPLNIAMIDDIEGLRAGEVAWWPSFRALITDRRGAPFLTPIIDWLDSYDQVLSNLVDRTALARYLAFDVTVNGTKDDVNEFIATRGGQHAPKSGTIEVHNESVAWKPINAEVGSFEDTNTSQTILTQIAGGSGLAKTWLAEPEGANRATSLTMAEPVRRRVGGVQKQWLARQTELVRFAVDQAVRAGRLPSTVESVDAAGVIREVPSSETVRVHGPEIAAADAKVTAEILTSLSTGLVEMVAAGVLTRAAAQIAAKKAWEDYAGIPYTAELDQADGSTTDKIAEVIDEAPSAGPIAEALRHDDEVASLRRTIDRLRQGRKLRVVRNEDGTAAGVEEVVDAHAR